MYEEGCNFNLIISISDCWISIWWPLRNVGEFFGNFNFSRLTQLGAECDLCKEKLYGDDKKMVEHYIRSSSDHLKIIFRSSSDHQMIIIWSISDHHQVIIRSSLDHHQVEHYATDHNKLEEAIVDPKSVPISTEVTRAVLEQLFPDLLIFV